ncbi:nucleoporin NUP35-like [Hyla sarda]|uniref:nucleoporin NUP35-like n=1 Tax=Hyla sarda TaxID=327740 RepID=UPI0024C451CD|nr:nucleoporin NUP35-like [Hyla sarda]
MAAFFLEPLALGGEPMVTGSPTLPKPGASAQFLPGFLMGDLPTPVTPQPRQSLGFMEARSPGSGGGSPPQPVVPAPKKSSAPPVGSIYDDLFLPGLNTTPLSSRKQTTFTAGLPPTPLSPYTSSSVFRPAAIGQSREAMLSPAHMDPFYTQSNFSTSDDHLDNTWVTVYGFPQASASYILQQFAQYGNIIKHVMSSTGNWMHLEYHSKLQARNALSKDGKIFGDCIMIGVKPCIEKSLMECSEKASTSSMYSLVTPPAESVSSPHSGKRPLAAAYTTLTSPYQNSKESSEKASVSSTYSAVTPQVKSVSSPRSGMRPLAAAYRAFTSPYQVFLDRKTPKKNDSLISKSLEYLFGW